MEKRHTIFIATKETALQSWLRDASSVCGAAFLIGIGVALQSSAMQWFGFGLASLFVVSKASNFAKRHTYDLKGARARLNEIEREMGAFK